MQREKVCSQEETISSQERKISALSHELARLKKLVYGSRSERNRIFSDASQLGLFAQDPVEASGEPEKIRVIIRVTYKHQKAPPGPQPPAGPYPGTGGGNRTAGGGHHRTEKDRGGGH